MTKLLSLVAAPTRRRHRPAAMGRPGHAVRIAPVTRTAESRRRGGIEPPWTELGPNAPQAKQARVGRISGRTIAPPGGACKN